MRGLLKLLGVIFLVCLGISIGHRSNEFNPPAAAPILEHGAPAESWTLDDTPSWIRFPEGAFRPSPPPMPIQTQQQTVNVYSHPDYDYNWWARSPSYSQMVRNLGTQRPPPIRRDRR